MKSREEILHRVSMNQSLRAEHAGLPDRDEIRRLLTWEVDQSVLIERFADELQSVGGAVIRTTEKNIADALVSYLRSVGAKCVLLSEDMLQTWVDLRQRLLAPSGGRRGTVEFLYSDDSRSPRDPISDGARDQRSADTGITACEALIAETGSVLIKSSDIQPRLTSLLPERHVVIARSNQLIGTLWEAFALIKKAEGGLPAAYTLVTGVSQTADIEKVLVKGVHGPRELCVILLEG